MNRGRFVTTAVVILALVAAFVGGWYANDSTFPSLHSTGRVERDVASDKNLRNVTCRRDDSTGTYDCAGSDDKGCNRVYVYDDGNISVYQDRSGGIKLPPAGC